MHDGLPRNSFEGGYTDNRDARNSINYNDHADYGDSDSSIPTAQLSVPTVPPRRDLKPNSHRRPVSTTTRPLNSWFGSNKESNRGSFSGSFGSGSPSPYNPSTSSPYTPSMRGHKGFNFVLDPSPPALMTRKQSRDEVAMVRHALKQNAYSRVSFFWQLLLLSLNFRY